MEATFSSETSVDFQRTAQRYIPEDRIVHNHVCENFKSYKHTPRWTKMFTYFLAIIYRLLIMIAVISIHHLFGDSLIHFGGCIEQLDILKLDTE
jgi:hypothetical protein